MRKNIFTIAIIAIIFVFSSCENNEIITKLDTINKMDESKLQTATNYLIKSSDNCELVKSFYNSVKNSLEYGLDEVLYLDIDVKNPNSYLFKSLKMRSISMVVCQNSDINNDSILTALKGLEVYWPYSENWDGRSIPVICYINSDFKYITEDKVLAYKLLKNENGISVLDSLIINEEYAKSNPVWIVRSSEFNATDLDKIFNLQATSNGLNYIPRNIDLIEKSKKQSAYSSTNSLVYETKIESIQSYTQHDTWISGGSEYILYWFFPTAGFGISTHQTSQIKISRSEISKNVIRALNFDANFDWFVGQEHNRLKVIEFDPGKDTNFDIKISSTYHEKDSPVTTTGEFKTTITLNNVDENIMDYTIARTAMFTVETSQPDGSYKRTFNGNGVNVVINIKSIQGIQL